MKPLAPSDVLTRHESFEHAWRLLTDHPAQARALASVDQTHPALALQARTVHCAADLGAGLYPEALAEALAVVDELRGTTDQLWLSRALQIAALASDALYQRDLTLARTPRPSDAARALQRFALHSPPLAHPGDIWYLTDRCDIAPHICATAQGLEQTAPAGRHILAQTSVNLGILECEAGRLAEGIALLERGRDLADTTGDLAGWVSAVSHLAHVHTELGEFAAARRALNGVASRSAELSGSAYRSLLFAQVRVEYQAGDLQAALLALGALHSTTLTGPEQQAALLIEADLHAQLGRYEEAYTLIERLAELTKQLNTRERDRQLAQLDEKYQVEIMRRDAAVQQLKAEAARREAEMEHLEKVELQRALESNAILIHLLRDSHLVSETLLGVSQLTQLDLDPVDLARHALTLVTRVVDADWCALACRKGGQVTFETVWARTEDSRAFASVTLPESRGVHEALLHSSASQDEPTFASSYERGTTHCPELVDAGLSGCASLPAGTALDVTYVLLLGRLGPDREWTERERRVLSATRHTLRAAVESQERMHRSREAALTDSLTGLANRRAFDERVRDAAGTAFSVAMLDLDGLKRTNDTRGHAAGDTLLRVFAAALRAQAPRDVQAFRLGGDEMALVMDGHSGPDPQVDRTVRAVVEASVAAVRTAGFPEAHCSFGVAGWPGEGRTPVDVVALADTRLYAEKQARRARRSAAERPPGGAVVFGDAVLDTVTRDVRGPLGQTKLSPRESELLRALVHHSQQVVTRADLTVMGGLAGNDTGGALDVHISNLRRKLAGVTEHAGIRTVRGQGFSLQWYEEFTDH